MSRSPVNPPPAVLDLVRGQRAEYEQLVRAVEAHAAVGDLERVLRWAAVAANYAWIAPTGRLADRRLEQLVVHAVRGGARPVVDGGRSTGRVLHVLSEAYGMGGHTRLASRWIARDHRRSDVALVHQRGEVPALLLDAVTAAGGAVHDLAAGRPPLADRAVALRALMDDVDVVVLHVHPWDSVPLAAVNLPGPRPPVIHEQHCDHMFWLGVGAADLVCDWREPAADLDVAARGVDPRRTVVLPMPIDRWSAGGGTLVRQQLGIPADAVVALTVSAQYKMAATSARGMPDLLDRALTWSPQLHAVVVGTDPTTEWARLSARWPGRVHALPRVPDPSPYVDAADVYLDSYPCGSATSLLEAAAAGVPVVVVTDVPAGGPGHMLQAVSPGLAGEATVPAFDKHALVVRRLVADRAARRTAGERVQHAVLARHDGAGWAARLEEVYARARTLPAVEVDDLAAPEPDDLDGAVLHQQHNRNGVVTPPETQVKALGDIWDDAMQADLAAVRTRGLGPVVTVRVRPGWELEPALTGRLLQLSARHPRLALSLPFVAGDDRQGSRTTAVLVAVLADVGLDPQTCGDLSVETTLPSGTPAVPGELPVVEEAVAFCELLVTSPCWPTGELVPS